MKLHNVAPNEITFVSLLSACSHAGMVDEGQDCYNSMILEYKIQPSREHYACMVDILGRAGKLEAAYEFIKSMPFVPHRDVWGVSLSACKVHNNVELAEIASKHVFECDDEGNEAGYYVMMSHIYAEEG
ncbi:hypothetical protein AMTRI_Chr07g25970 [Amborella trichopoda]